MEITAYTMEGHRIEIRPAPLERDWMDDTRERFAYRCLPLNIANAHGWEMLLPAGFKAHWTGGPGQDDVKVRPDPGTTPPAMGHFGHGVLTIPVNCLFRTEPGYDLMVQGPINRPKDAIAPLSGIIETDWAPYTFTMNWKFTRSGTIVRFEAGEPFCHFFPVKRGEIEDFAPRIRSLDEAPDIKRQHDGWMNERLQFIEDLRDPDSKAREDRWQKTYFRGLDPDGKEQPDHRTRVKLKPFAK